MVDEGDMVETGDPILKMDDRLAALEADAVQARVQEAEARHGDAIRVRDELLSLRQAPSCDGHLPALLNQCICDCPCRSTGPQN